ncbi:MAG: sigma-70 family RNA polymerase sigma factor [Gammaproteobacteria bacterium]
MAIVSEQAHPSLARDRSDLARLIQAIVGRDQAALADLYELTVNRVYSLAMTMARNANDAEEIVGDVYLQIWQRAAQYDPERGSVLAWLLVQCRSLALDLLRRRRPQRAIATLLAQQEGGEEAKDESWTAEELLSFYQEGSAVHRALASLNEMQRRLIGLAFFQGLSHQEIADAVQLPVGTVKSHIRRGLQHLRKTIEL